MSTNSTAAENFNPFASWRIEHAGLLFPDFDAAAAWYAEKLGFQVMSTFPIGNKTYGFLAPPDGSFSFEFMGGPGPQPRPGFTDLGTSQGLSGLHHVCFRVENVDAVVAALKERGMRIVSEPRDVPAISSRFAFFADPWGNLFEVIQAISL